MTEQEDPLASQLKMTKTIFTAIMKQCVDSTFKYPEGGATTKAVKGFLDRLVKEYQAVTPQRLTDFCICTIYNNRSMPHKPIKTLFGGAALSRFKERKKGQEYFEDRWLEQHKLTRASLIALIADKREHPHAKYIFIQAEEPTKLRLLNQKTGYLVCQASTLGWSPLSPACKQCQFTPDCMRATQKKYPELFRLRKENNEQAN